MRQNAPHPLTRQHLAMSAGACWLGMFIVTMLMLTGYCQEWDVRGLLFWRQGDTLSPSSQQLLGAVRDVTALGGVILRNMIACLAIIVCWLISRRREALFLVSVVLGGWLLNTALKVLIARPRPSVVPHLMAESGFSFPSGHSFNATVVYLSIALIIQRCSRNKALSLFAISLALVLSITIAWSRVWLGVHWPSDTFAGLLGGLAWTLTCFAILTWQDGHKI